MFFVEILLPVDRLIGEDTSPLPFLFQVNLDAAFSRIKGDLQLQGTQPYTKDHRTFLNAYVRLLASTFKRIHRLKMSQTHPCNLNPIIIITIRDPLLKNWPKKS